MGPKTRGLKVIFEAEAPRQDVKNYDRKELIALWDAVGLNDNGELVHFLRARGFASRTNQDGMRPFYGDVRVYAPDGTVYYGAGRVGGYGYHKLSALFQEVLDNAGIQLSDSISGVGDGAIRDAIQAIGHALGYPTIEILEY